jgi:hypothetical protein
MGLETLFAMGGVLLLLATLGMWSGARQRVRAARARRFHAGVAPIPPKPARRP